jgi:hypothetical protein
MKSTRRRVPLKKSRKTKKSVKKHSVRKRRTAKKGGCDCMMKGGDGYVNGPTFPAGLTENHYYPLANIPDDPNNPSTMHDARLDPQPNEPSVDPSLGISSVQQGGRRRRHSKLHRSKKGGSNPLDTMMTRGDGTMNTNNLVGSSYNSDISPIA